MATVDDAERLETSPACAATRPVPAPGQTRLLWEIAKWDLNRLAEAINLILDVRDAEIRIAAPVAIGALVPGFPVLGPLVLDRLTRSLELDVPDRYGPSADVCLRRHRRNLYFPSRIHC